MVKRYYNYQFDIDIDELIDENTLKISLEDGTKVEAPVEVTDTEVFKTTIKKRGDIPPDGTIYIAKYVDYYMATIDNRVVVYVEVTEETEFVPNKGPNYCAPTTAHFPPELIIADDVDEAIEYLKKRYA